MDSEQSEPPTTTNAPDSARKPASSGFEYLAFSITRYFVLVLTFLALLSVIIAAAIFIYNFTGSSTSVSYSDVAQRLYGGNNRSSAGGGSGGQQSYSGYASYHVPMAVKVWFADSNNNAVLNGWISKVATPERQDFVNGLEKVVLATQQNGTSTENAANAYQDLWFEKKASGLIGKAYAITLLPYAGIAFGVFAVLSFILALLAIERNTRSRA